MQFSAVHRVEDVVRYLRFRLKLRRWQNIDICKGVEILTQDTLGTLAEATGNVELSAARYDSTPAEMRQAALKRADLCAETGEWEAFNRELSEASYWVAEERESMASSIYVKSAGVFSQICNVDVLY